MKWRAKSKKPKTSSICLDLIIYIGIVVSLDTLIWGKLNTSGQLLPPRAGHTTVALGRNMFVFGGFTDEQNLYDDIYMLDVGKKLYDLIIYFFCFFLIMCVCI